MLDFHDNQPAQTIERLIRWANDQPLVRAMILTSTLAIPGGAADILSDYDVILAVTDIRPFYDERAWLEAFGPLLAVYRDPLVPYLGLTTSAYVVQYESGLKIDFTLWPVEVLRELAAMPELLDELDAGYRILLDKEHLTDGLKPPTYRAYIPKPPAEDEFLKAIEEFFLESVYVAKYLWRDDVMAAKHILDAMMKQEQLRPMLEWQVEIDHGWSVKPGPYGRRLKQWLRREVWVELEGTYTGADVEANWEALFRTIGLFHKVASEVGNHLGYHYPEDLDRRAVAYVREVKNLDHSP